MRIGIDCHTILPLKAGEERPFIALYTYYLVKNLIQADQKNEYVLFFDTSSHDANEFQKPNVTIRKAPFIRYWKYLPANDSHLLISNLLAREKLDLFHSPEGFVPLDYKGKDMITVHEIPKSERKQEAILKTLELGASIDFKKYLAEANVIIVHEEEVLKRLKEDFKIAEEKIKFFGPLGVMGEYDFERMAHTLIDLYLEIYQKE